MQLDGAKGPLRPLACCLVTAVLASLGACAGPTEIRPLATGQAHRAAYELNGGQLDVLRREAQKLCPAGADVVRQAAAGQRFEVGNSRWQRWLKVASDVVDPPQQQAQLVVVCHGEAPGLSATLAPLPVPAPVASAPAPAKPVEHPEPLAAAPIGPLMPEW